MCPRHCRQIRLLVFLVLGGVFWIAEAAAVLIIPENHVFIATEATDSRIENHGVIRSATADRFVFGPETLVKGSGYFENTLSLGTFAPGNSPGVTTGKNQAFAGTVEIELGGTTAGFGSGQHDQINDNGTVTLDATTSVLSILSFEGYVPTVGDEFEVLTWQTALDGDFGTITYDPIFAINGITFTALITNPTGPGSLTLTAVPEPSAFLFGGLVCGLVGLRARPRRERC